MKLIAKKPCSFGGRQFYIGEEIPADLVADARQQEHYGIIAIVNAEGVPGGESGMHEKFQNISGVSWPDSPNDNPSIQEQYKQDMAELQAYRELGVTPEQIRQIDRSYAELAKELAQVKKESAGGIVINLRGWDYSETGRAADVTATPEQIQQAFGILQCTAEDGVKYIADITDKTVLLLIHAADSRKTVKNAAKEQAGKLSSTQEETNAATDTHTEGS